MITRLANALCPLDPQATRAQVAAAGTLSPVHASALPPLSSEKQAKIGAGMMLPCRVYERRRERAQHPPRTICLPPVRDPSDHRSVHIGQCIVDESCSSVAATENPGSSRGASFKLTSGSRQGSRITGGQRRRDGGTRGSGTAGGRP